MNIKKTSHDSHAADSAVPRPHFDDGVLSSSSLLEHSSSPSLQNLPCSGIMQSFNAQRVRFCTLHTGRNSVLRLCIGS